MTWSETGDRVTRLAAGLLALGIEPEQRVGIASGTRFEWILADLAIMCAGARDHDGLPVDERRGRRPTSWPTPSAASCSPRTTSQIAKLMEHKSELPHLTKVVTFDGDAPTATG